MSSQCIESEKKLEANQSISVDYQTKNLPWQPTQNLLLDYFKSFSNYHEIGSLLKADALIRHPKLRSYE